MISFTYSLASILYFFNIVFDYSCVTFLVTFLNKYFDLLFFTSFICSRKYKKRFIDIKMGILKNFEGDGHDNEHINSLTQIDPLINAHEFRYMIYYINNINRCI